MFSETQKQFAILTRCFQHSIQNISYLECGLGNEYTDAKNSVVCGAMRNTWNASNTRSGTSVDIGLGTSSEKCSSGLL
ncbi:hypothetical protein L596_030037 [Steinernema carpocapsae]|uniref:Uncharacterized protein n=1 Tax=Steinernema carpocapsae TaxID=34508 RepID=A0A4U5LRJ2_STECR|nr:hypothetical protein L596_030037 [Steinernema carpocapsae]